MGDRDPAERRGKGNGCSSQTERAGWWFRAVEEGSKCRAFAEMQGQCTRCRRALGRTREGKKSSSWCWLQLFSAARLCWPRTPLPAFCCAGWLTRLAGTTATGPLSGRWGTWLARGSSGQAATKSEQGLRACRRGRPLRGLYARLYLRCPQTARSISRVRRRRARAANANCHCKASRFGRSLCNLPLRVRGLLVRQLRGRTGPPEKPTIWRLFSLVWRRSGGLEVDDPPMNFLRHEPA